MNKIKLSSIKNMSNYCVSKSGNVAKVTHILMRLHRKFRGKFPTFYYEGTEIEVDVTKDDIEKIVYCDHCGYQDLSENYIADQSCPYCGQVHSYGWEGYRLKGTKDYIYSDADWRRFNIDFKEQFKDNLGSYIITI